MIRWIIGKFLGEKKLLNGEPVNVRALCDASVISGIRQKVWERAQKFGKDVEIIEHTSELTGIDSDTVCHLTKAKLIAPNDSENAIARAFLEDNFRRFIHHMTQPIEDIRVTTLHGDVEVWQVGSHRIDRDPKSDIVTWSCVAKMVRKFHPA